MFRGLHVRLTLTYMVVALMLIALVGVGTYALLVQYFQSGTDLALQHEMVTEFRNYNKPLTPDLASAEQVWDARRVPKLQNAEEAPEGPRTGPHQPDADDAYNADIAAIFVIPISSKGDVITDEASITLPMDPDIDAFHSALATGIDWRTVTLSNGVRVRLLSYRVPNSTGDEPDVLQMGRTLGDQDQTLTRLLLVLLALGGASAILLGVASWWVAGRSLRPAQLAWERQQSFVANASHELRTPLAIMRASTEVALRTIPKDDTDKRELLGDVLQETDHMSSLVEDLLLLSRLDAGRLKMEQTNVAVPEMLSEIQRQVRALASKKGVKVEMQDAGGTAWGDPARLRQVLIILVDNALRHTPSGGSVTLSARADGNVVHLDVIDTGSGITPEDLPHVFERFYRGSGNEASPEGENTAGSGLGLPIARSLIEAQGGKITLESTPGVGTHAQVTLPAGSSSHKKARSGAHLHLPTAN